MKFGIFTLLDYARGSELSLAELYRQTLDHIEYADRLGLEAYWVGEHHFYLNSAATLACPNPAVLLAAAAQRTTRIGLNTAVANLSLRHPLQLAEDYAMVDLLSGGRLGFGIGRGAYGHEYPPFGQRREESAGRFEEAWQIIQQAWGGAPVNFEGQFFTIKDATLNVLPVQQPLPKYWLATMSPASFAARGSAAQPIIAFPHLTANSLAEMGKLAGDYRANFSEVTGHTGYDLPMIFHTHLADSREEAQRDGVAALRRYIAHEHAAQDIPGSLHHLQARQQLFFGTPGDIIELIEQYQAATHSNYFIFWLDFGGMAPDLVRRSMELLANEVMPYFKH